MGILYIALYKYDNLMVHDFKAIDDMIATLRKKVDTQNQGWATWLIVLLDKIFNEWKEGLFRTAPSHQKFGKKFGECVKNTCSHNTPCMPKFLIGRPDGK